ncbi:hypothetical protein [Acutalibacter sp.]|uniref:hypothetical protein n=1 Tax=Acutalibacter sp. TaxID=1918636 RepID=UPI00216F9EB0|nr:hypothetical protein [Acutalibacter sp.]
MGRNEPSFPADTFREDVWHWFDDRHSKGVSYLMYGGEGQTSIDKSEEREELT